MRAPTASAILFLSASLASALPNFGIGGNFQQQRQYEQVVRLRYTNRLQRNEIEVPLLSDVDLPAQAGGPWYTGWQDIEPSDLHDVEIVDGPSNAHCMLHTTDAHGFRALKQTENGAVTVVARQVFDDPVQGVSSIVCVAAADAAAAGRATYEAGHFWPVAEQSEWEAPELRKLKRARTLASMQGLQGSAFIHRQGIRGGDEDEDGSASAHHHQSSDFLPPSPASDVIPYYAFLAGKYKRLNYLDFS